LDLIKNVLFRHFSRAKNINMLLLCYQDALHFTRRFIIFCLFGERQFNPLGRLRGVFTNISMDIRGFFRPASGAKSPRIHPAGLISACLAPACRLWPADEDRGCENIKPDRREIDRNGSLPNHDRR
jgi:hypothetical protein